MIENEVQDDGNQHQATIGEPKKIIFLFFKILSYFKFCMCGNVHLNAMGARSQ